MSATKVVSPFDLGPVTTPYGAPSAFTGTPHTGVDIGTASGTPIPAFIGGTVSRVFQDAVGGLQVMVTTPEGFQEVYAHLAATNVTPGQNVGASDVIGWSGATGHVTGPHLHYEVRKPGGGTMDPLAFLGEFASGGASTSGGGKPATPALTAATCGLDAGTISVIGDRLRNGHKPQEIADELTKSLGRPITVECMRNDSYQAAHDVGALIDAAASIPVLGGAAQATAGGISGVLAAGDFLKSPGSAGKIGFTLVGAALIIVGVVMYLGALKGEHLADAIATGVREGKTGGAG